MKFIYSSLILCLLILSSCGKKTPDHIGLVPQTSSMVIALNSKQLIEDNFFDLIANANAFDGDGIKNPSEIGIESLADYYMFFDGSDVMQSRIGGVFPLSDENKLVEYINSEKAVITEEEGIKFITISGSYTIGIHKKIALFMYAPFGGDLKADISSKFKSWLDENNLVDVTVFNDLKSNKGHLKIWADQYKVMSVISMFGQQFGIAPNIDINKLKGDNLLTSLSFDNEKVVVNFQKYIGDNSVNIAKSLQKPNAIKPLLNIFQTDKNPIAVFSTSMNVGGLKEMLATYLSDEKLKNNINLYFDYEKLFEVITGDFIASYYGSSVDQIEVLEPVIDPNTGDYFERKISKEIQIPVFAAAFGIKDSNSLNLLLGEAKKLFIKKGDVYFIDKEKLQGLQEYAGIVNSGLSFKIENQKLIIASGNIATNVLNGNGVAPQKLENEITSKPTVIYLDTKTLLNESAYLLGSNKIYTDILAGKINAITIITSDLEGNVQNQVVEIDMQEGEHSLVTLFKIFEDVKSLSENMVL